jgi:hypothetical protein
LRFLINRRRVGLHTEIERFDLQFLAVGGLRQRARGGESGRGGERQSGRRGDESRGFLAHGDTPFASSSVEKLTDAKATTASRDLFPLDAGFIRVERGSLWRLSND